MTGSGAVAGSALRRVAHEHSDAEFVFAVSRDADLTDARQTRELFQTHQPDGVIHLAAVSGGIALSAQHQASLLRDNTLMTFHVLEAARELSVKKVVMTLSAGAYPVSAPLPLREDSLHDGWPADNNFGSSFAKRLVDPAVRAYREEYGLCAVGLIPGGIFGPDDNFHPLHAPMLPSLIRRFCEGADDDPPIDVWGDGSPLREYTYSDDVARIFLWALHEYDEPTPLNVGSTEERSIREIAEMVADASGVPRRRIRYDPSKPSGVPRRTTDNSRFRNRHPYAYLPLAEGIQRTVRWFQETRAHDQSGLRTHAKLRQRLAS